MKRIPFLTWLAIALLAGTFLYSAVRLFQARARAIVAPGTEVIRFAHWQLEPGVGGAQDGKAQDYKAR
jgi:hypothetical protein